MKTRTPLVLTLLVPLWLGCGGEPEETESAAPPPTRATPAAADTQSTAANQPAETRTAETGGTPAADAGTVLASSLGARVYAVQVGAFARDANTARMVARLSEEGFPVWETDTLVGGQTLRRVRVGAVTDRAQVGRLASMLEQRLGSAVWIAPVSPETRLPGGVADATRRVLSG